MRKSFGFTLVELIVVITILAILGTIWFLSFQGYAVSARDSKRVTDLWVIERWLQYYFIIDNVYPEIAWWIDISYSWSLLWKQWTFDDDIVTEIRRVPTKPIDPLTWEEYIYSVTHDRKEYQLWAILENFAYTNTIDQVYANQWFFYTWWNYNWVLLSRLLWSDLFIFAVPSLVVNSESSLEISDIVTQQLFIKNWLSSDVSDFLYSSPEDIIVFTWSTSDFLQRDDIYAIIWENVFDVFKGTSFENSEFIRSITQYPEVNDENIDEISILTEQILSNIPWIDSLVKQKWLLFASNQDESDTIWDITQPQVDGIFDSPEPIEWNSWQQRIVSNYYTLVWSFPWFEWGVPVNFTVSGDGNPTVQTQEWWRSDAWVIEWGTNLEIDVPPVWGSYTAYLHVGNITLSFTVSRNPEPGMEIQNLDFWVTQVWYHDWRTHIQSNQLNFGFQSPASIIVSWDGNPTAQLVWWSRWSSWDVQYSTNIQVEIPPRGETYVATIELLWTSWTFTVIRDSQP